MTMVSLRGAPGAGKTHVVKTILGMYYSTPDLGRDGKPLGHLVQLPTGAFLYIVGGCATARGAYADDWPRIQGADDAGHHALFEGAYIHARAGDGVIFAYLDTSLEMCLDRLHARRVLKGNFRRLDPANTAFEHQHVSASIEAAQQGFYAPADLGRRVVVVDHHQPVKTILKLFNVTLSKEPIHEC